MARLTTRPPVPPTHLFGFFFNDHKLPKASLEAIKSVVQHMPESPIYFVGSGGYHYNPLAARYATVHFHYDPINASPIRTKDIDAYMQRVRDACLYCNCSYLVMMEPDVILRDKLVDTPEHDAGGVNDISNPSYPKSMEKEFHVSNWSWSHWGMCGGSYVKVDSFLKAYQNLNYTRMKQMEKVSGLEITMHQDLLFAVMMMDQGYILKPWKDLSEMMHEKRGDKWTPLRHKVKTHYGKPLLVSDGPVISNTEAKKNDWPMFSCNVSYSKLPLNSSWSDFLLNSTYNGRDCF